MKYPSLIPSLTEADYRRHYENKYCRQPIKTFDGIEVRFNKKSFKHAFYESVGKQQFSEIRAERIDWISATLLDPLAELFVGWNRRKKSIDRTRRIALSNGNYVVVIKLRQNGVIADFITAFVADSPRSLIMIRQSPKWS